MVVQHVREPVPARAGRLLRDRPGQGRFQVRPQIDVGPQVVAAGGDERSSAARAFDHCGPASRLAPGVGGWLADSGQAPGGVAEGDVAVDRGGDR